MKCYEITEESVAGFGLDATSLVGLGNGSLSKEFEELFEQAVRESLEVRLTRAGITEGGKLVREEGRSDHALVLIRTQPGAGGKMWLEANSFEEVVEKGRVQRVYGDWPPPGVVVRAQGAPPNEGQLLIEMLPGSSFRVCRDGQLEGASPVLIVAWPGSSLRCFPPKRYQQASASE